MQVEFERKERGGRERLHLPPTPHPLTDRFLALAFRASRLIDLLLFLSTLNACHAS